MPGAHPHRACVFWYSFHSFCKAAVDFSGRGASILAGEHCTAEALKHRSTRMVPFRWAITSAGKIAADFAHAVRQLEGHEVVAVAARSEAAARASARGTPAGAAASARLREAMFRCDRHGADACYVATRPDSHRALCERLIARRVPTPASSARDVGGRRRGALRRRRRQPHLPHGGRLDARFPATAKARELLAAARSATSSPCRPSSATPSRTRCPDGVRGSAATRGMGRDIGVYLAEKALLAFDSRDYDLADARGVAVLGRGDGVDLAVAASARMVGRDPKRRGGVASLLWTRQCDTPEVCAVLGTAGSLRFAATHHTPRTLEARRARRAPRPGRRCSTSPSPATTARTGGTTPAPSRSSTRRRASRARCGPAPSRRPSGRTRTRSPRTASRERGAGPVNRAPTADVDAAKPGATHGERAARSPAFDATSMVVVLLHAFARAAHPTSAVAHGLPATQYVVCRDRRAPLARAPSVLAQPWAPWPRAPSILLTPTSALAHGRQATPCASPEIATSASPHASRSPRPRRRPCGRAPRRRPRRSRR